MKENLVITIGRECGSSGRAIGRKLAESLGIKCYDKELLALAAKNSGLCEELFKTHDEKPTNSFLYSLVMDTYSMGYNTSAYMDMPINHKIFLAQFDTIKKLADEESCVIVGRCADYVLREKENCLNVYIYSDLDDRVARATTYYSLSPERAREQMQKMDKKRASYYNFYTNLKWGRAENYDLSLNSAKVGIDGCVDVIRAFAERMEAVAAEKKA